MSGYFGSTRTCAWLKLKGCGLALAGSSPSSFSSFLTLASFSKIWLRAHRRARHGEQYTLGGGRHPDYGFGSQALDASNYCVGQHTLVAKQLWDDSMWAEHSSNVACVERHLETRTEDTPWQIRTQTHRHSAWRAIPAWRWQASSQYGFGNQALDASNYTAGKQNIGSEANRGRLNVSWALGECGMCGTTCGNTHGGTTQWNIRTHPHSHTLC